MKRHVLFLLALLCFVSVEAQSDSTLNLKISNWKFQTGNDLRWSQPEFDDSSWPEIEVPSRWENAGYPEYDGYAWYRAKIYLSSKLKNENYGGIVIHLGHLDDRDSTFMNGRLIGNMNRWNDDRSYLLAFDDPTIQWDAENQLAVQVYDNSGGGGMYGRETEIELANFVDFVQIDNTSFNIKLTERTKLSKKIIVSTDNKIAVSGQILLSIENKENQSVLLSKEIPVDILKNQPFEYVFSAEIPAYTPCIINYRFSDNKVGKTVEKQEGIPYILTPPAPEFPRINGAKVYGVRAGSPIVYRIPATGILPIKYWVGQLPSGLTFNAEKGIISGTIEEAGEYELMLHAENAKGSDQRSLKIVVGDRISLTPPMGWNSWNCWGLLVDDAKVRAAADVFISERLADYGWNFINIDDGWQAGERTEDGRIQPNSKFPDMKELTDYVHSLGLKVGIYSSPGKLTCGGFLGSFDHELQDVESWADWGFDYIKYDWCSYKSIKPNPSLDEMKEPYMMLGEFLQDQSRDIIFSLCQYGMGKVWEWGDETQAQLWRTTGDIEDSWKSMSKIGFNQAEMSEFARPGNWNDPDMLVVGRLGWGDPRPTRLTPDEQYTHISLWSLLAAPLLIGCDLDHLDDFTKSLLCNSEVIDINQDALGKQANRILKENQIEVWMKPLDDGSMAIGVFNLSDEYRKEVTVPWTQLDIEGEYTVRDVWKQQDTGNQTKELNLKIPGHGVVLLRLTKAAVR